jgi:alpha-L-fucosidase
MNAPARPQVEWQVFAVGKPGMDYSIADHHYTGTVLTWKFATIAQKDLIDQVAAVNAEMAKLKKWVEAAKEILKTYAPAMLVGDTKPVNGSIWVASYSKRSRSGLDGDAVKAEMGDAWWAAHCKDTEFVEIRFKKIGAPEAAPEAE